MGWRLALALLATIGVFGLLLGIMLKQADQNGRSIRGFDLMLGLVCMAVAVFSTLAATAQSPCSPFSRRAQQELVAEDFKFPSQAVVVTPAEIDKFFPVTLVTDEPMCAVCLTLVEVEEPCRKLDCTHVFHGECITQWWTRVTHRDLTCPVCRRPQSFCKLVDDDDARHQPDISISINEEYVHERHYFRRQIS